MQESEVSGFSPVGHYYAPAFDYHHHHHHHHHHFLPTHYFVLHSLQFIVIDRCNIFTGQADYDVNKQVIDRYDIFTRQSYF